MFGAVFALQTTAAVSHRCALSVSDVAAVRRHSKTGNHHSICATGAALTMAPNGRGTSRCLGFWVWQDHRCRHRHFADDVTGVRREHASKCNKCRDASSKQWCRRWVRNSTGIGPRWWICDGGSGEHCYPKNGSGQRNGFWQSKISWYEIIPYAEGLRRSMKIRIAKELDYSKTDLELLLAAARVMAQRSHHLNR